MSNATFTYEEVRIDLRDPDLTQVYVAIRADGDCPIGVQGWHHKTFSGRIPAAEILLTFGVDDPVMWPLRAPDET